MKLTILKEDGTVACMCSNCKEPATYFGADPYASEIYDDHFEIFLCDTCYHISCDEL